MYVMKSTSCGIFTRLDIAENPHNRADIPCDGTNDTQYAGEAVYETKDCVYVPYDGADTAQDHGQQYADFFLHMKDLPLP